MRTQALALHTEGEEWKAVAFAPHYQVSTLGRVKNTETGHLLTAAIHQYSLSVTLHTRTSDRADESPSSKSKTARSRVFAVHRLVWAAFRGPLGRWRRVKFRDDNRCNPALANLYVEAPSKKTKDRRRRERYRYVSMAGLWDDLMRETMPTSYAAIWPTGGNNR